MKYGQLKPSFNCPYFITVHNCPSYLSKPGSIAFLQFQRIVQPKYCTATENSSNQYVLALLTTMAYHLNAAKPLMPFIRHFCEVFKQAKLKGANIDNLFSTF